LKYWRGYLTAAIFAAITWALMKMGETFTDLVDAIYPYITRTLQDMLATWSGTVDFCLWQVIVMLLVVLALATIVLMVVLRWNPIQWLGWILAVCAGLFMVHTAIYGLNQYAGPLADDIRLDVSEYSTTELADAAEYYRDKANTLAASMERDASGDLVYSSFEELAGQAGEGFDHLVYNRFYSIFAGNTLPVKKLGWADMYTSMGITGVTMGVTGEAAVNPQIPSVGLPFTMCHEMAHRMCIAVERDANFAGFLAARYNSSKEFQYSAYFMAYRYCYNALAKLNTSSANALAKDISAGVNDYLRHDLKTYNDFFTTNRNQTATQVADKANDTYIKVSGDDRGVQSYGDVCDLLVNWYLQEMVLPYEVEDEEDKFDPFDEDYVFATLPETTDETTADEDD